MKRRVLLLTLSVLLAALGTGLVAVYVRSAEDRAARGQEMLTVLVAADDIPARTSATRILQDAVEERSVPRAGLAPDALVGKAGKERLAALTTATTLIDIQESTPLTASMFGAGDPGRASVDPAFVEVQLDIEGAHAAAGLLQPGAEVMVLITFREAVERTKVLVPRARVLAISGQSGDAESATGSTVPVAEGTQGTVALAVSLRDAELLVLAQETKDVHILYFVRPGEKTPDRGQVTVRDLQ